MQQANISQTKTLALTLIGCLFTTVGTASLSRSQSAKKVIKMAVSSEAAICPASPKQATITPRVL